MSERIPRVDAPSVFGLKWLVKLVYPPLAAAMMALGVSVPMNDGEIGSGFGYEVVESTWPLYIAVGVWIAVFGVRNMFLRRPIELSNDRLILRYELNHVRPHVISRTDVACLSVSDKAIDSRGEGQLLARVVKFTMADAAGFESELRSRWRDVRFIGGTGNGG